jgi:hypothetical protein
MLVYKVSSPIFDMKNDADRQRATSASSVALIPDYEDTD